MPKTAIELENELLLMAYTVRKEWANLDFSIIVFSMKK